MCDDVTEAESEAYLHELRVSRRELGIGAGTALAALLTGCGAGAAPTTRAEAEASPPTGAPPAPSPGSASAPEPARAAVAGTAGRMVTIETPDGSAEAFFVARQDRAHPGVLMWPDVAGLRDAYVKMATRLAEQGYAVLAVNPYYRSSPLPILTTFAEWRTDEARAKITPMREALTPEATTRDGAAFVAWLRAQKEVDASRKLASTGYCMGGPFTFRTAAAAPEHVGVIASFHGGGLATEAATSPHRLLEKLELAALICIAQNDDARQPEAKDLLRKAAEAAQIPAEIEVYPAQHGWCTIDSPVYDEAQAERAWARLLATLTAHL